MCSRLCYGIVRAYLGHGPSAKCPPPPRFHEEPHVPNYGPAHWNSGAEASAAALPRVDVWVLAVEPM